MDDSAVISIGTHAEAAVSTLMHPHYVLRIAGEPTDKLASLGTGHANESWERIVALRERSSAMSHDVCDRLASVVPGILDAVERRRVLDLRRALHNGRPAKQNDLDAARAYVDSALFAQISELDRIHADCADALARFEATHTDEMQAGAKSMAQLLDSSNLQSALSYNNPRLLSLLRNQYENGRRPSTDAKTIRNLEDSLLQFYARASTKTSPLSSLTLMRVGRWQGADGARSTQLSNRIERRVEAKAALMRHIFDGWLRDYEKAGKAFPLTINPAAVDTQGKIALQRVTAGRDFIGRIWGTGVDAAKFDANPVLACIEHALNEAPDRSLHADALIARIAALAPKLPLQAVEGFLKKLFEIGYLVANTGFFEQMDMLEWAASVVPTEGDGSAESRQAIARVRDDLEVMRGDDVERRIEASVDVNAAIFDLATATGASRGGYLYRTPYYENCYYVGEDRDLSADSLEAYRDEFELIQQVNRLADANQLVHTSLCDYFVSCFGKDGVCTDVQGFIEKFDVTYAPLVSEGKIDAEGVAEHSAHTRALMTARRALEEYVRNQIAQGRDAQLDPVALRGIVAMLPGAMRRRNVSYSYLVQRVSMGGAEGLVLNQVYGGRSGILSRFCEVLDADGLSELQAYLRKGSRSGRNTELAGVFGFNANRHPAMSQRELVISPFAPSYPDTQKISLSDLELRYLPDEHRLVFMDREANVVDIWYHGLLTPVMLPAIHRTIALAFSEGPCYLFQNALSQAIESNDTDVVYSPRLTLGRVVMSRRSWRLAYSTCPDASLPAAKFYLAIREWQKTHALPDRFFIRALLGGGGDKTRISRYEAMKDINFKDLKPFYVDLRSPRFVRLLQNMLKRHALTLLVSELLPDFDEHASSVESDRCVSELHFELTGGAGESSGEDPHWYALRVAYFGDRRSLILGPIAQAMEFAKKQFGIDRIFFVPHWKFGPHVDLVLQCDSSIYATRVLPVLQSILEEWIGRNPSGVHLDPQEYEQKSRWIGTFEIDSGPYLPLLRDNSVAPVPYVRPKTLLIPEVAESKELMLSDCSGLLIELFRLKDEDKDAFFLTLHSMLVATANTPDQGAKEGYMSMRSHADYFFASHDTDDALRTKFDGFDAKNSERLDKATLATVQGRYDEAGLPEPFARILAEWVEILKRVDARSRRIVELKYDELVGQNDRFMEMATEMRQDVPDEFFQRVEKREISKVGDAFINTGAGQEALRRPEFLAYRLNVNFFYALLPLLEVAPIQKFLLCHLLSNSIERVFDQDWRKKVEKILAIERARQ